MVESNINTTTEQQQASSESRDDTPLDMYIYEGDLGHGAYGVVYKGRH